MTSASLAPISEVFLGAFRLLSQKKVPTAIAALSFTMLLAVSSTAVQFTVMNIEDEFMSELSLDRDQLRSNIDADIAVISTMKFPEFLQQSGYTFGSTSPMQPTGEHALGIRYMMKVAPIVALQLVCNIATLFVAFVFFLLFFSRGSESAYETAQRLPRYILRMSGLLIWMLIRSWMWIPFIGPFLALYFVPRLSLAPVFLVSGTTGVFQSLRLSMTRTSGHWLGVFIRLALIIIVSFLMFWAALVVVVGVSLLSVKLGFILLLLSLVFAIAFQCASFTVLGAMMA